MSESFAFEEVEHFTAGAVGEPGARTFYIQAGAAGTVVSFKCEKQQVGALAEYLTGVIADLPPVAAAPASMDLIDPILAEWTVGMMSVAYDDSNQRIVLVIEELLDTSALDPDQPEPESASLRVRLTLPQVVAYVAHASGEVEAGRPPCPLCGNPMGPDHHCPKTNGHGPPR